MRIEELSGTVAIVTGAASGIGRATCERLAREGAALVAVDLERGALEEVATSTGATPIAGDVGDAGLWDRALEAAAALGGPGIVHLNAGVYGFAGPIEDLPLEVYRRTIDANIGGVVLGTRAAVPALRERGGGAIVATASVAAIVAFEGNPLYTLTKQAVGGFVRALAPHLAPDEISIDAVCPGIVDTPMTVEALAGADPAALGIPLLDAERIADAVVDLVTTEGTGRCRAVRERADPIDWSFPTWSDLAHAGRDR